MSNGLRGTSRILQPRMWLVVTLCMIVVSAGGITAFLHFGYGGVRRGWAVTRIRLNGGKVSFPGSDWGAATILLSFGPDVSVTQEVLAEAQYLPEIGAVHLNGAKVQVGALLHLSSLRGLTHIWLTDTNDDIFADVVRVQALEEIYVRQSGRLTDRGILHIGAVDRLRVLELRDTGVTDRGLDVLRQCPSLEAVYLGCSVVPISRTEPRRSNISDAGLFALQKLRALKTLGLSGTGVTDDGLRTIAQMGTLEELILDGTDVTDEGLKHLLDLRRLRRVALSGTRVSAEGITQFVNVMSQRGQGVAVDR